MIHGVMMGLSSSLCFLLGGRWDFFFSFSICESRGMGWDGLLSLFSLSSTEEVLRLL